MVDSLNSVFNEYGYTMYAELTTSQHMFFPIELFEKGGKGGCKPAALLQTD